MDKENPNECCKKCGVEVAENKDGSRTILLDKQFYVPLAKKDITINRLKPTMKRLDKVGDVLVENRHRLDNCSKDFHTLLAAQKEIDLNLIKIAETLAKLDTSYNNQ
tara:strand:+ start:348 stop:668 length:321 start_codon:yes stop_codon:yes gene_type:complete